MIWDICKALLLACLAYITFKIAMLYKRQRQLEAQGVRFSRYFPIISDIYRIMYYSYYYSEEFMFMRWFEDQFGEDPPAIAGINVFGTMALAFNRVEALDELYVTKNAVYSKHELERSLSMPLLRNAIISMETEDPTYKIKRKALSAAFLKSKMNLIMNNIKMTAMRCFHDLQAKGDVNEVDLNLYTQEVQSSIIVSIIIGPGTYNDKI